MARKNSKENYLDKVAVRNPEFVWREHADGHVIVDLPHTGIFDRLVQTLFHKPSITKIDLDELSSFIWKQLDGQRTIYDVAQLVHAEFGEKAEPLYNRIVKFFEILKDNKFIKFLR